MLPSDVDRALSLPKNQIAQALNEIPENQWFERKTGAIQPPQLAIPIVAMANSEGGIIVVGLHGGKVVPVSDKSSNDFRQVALDYTTPTVRVQVQELMLDEGRILIFRVSPGEYVYETNKGECFQRVGDESRKLTYSQRQQLEWDRGPQIFDGVAAPNIDFDDLDFEQIDQYRAALGATDIKRALQARNLLTVDGKVTVAGYLLFAKQPQVLYPNACVRVLKYTENERGVGRYQNLEVGADVRCEGSIPQQIHEAVAAIENFIPKKRALTEAGVFENIPIIPRDAWLEALINAVVHRSYSMAGDYCRVEIFPNRIEVTSPGRFPGQVDPSNAEMIVRYARNPRIARVCADLGITQELGEGIRRIFSEMRRVGLLDPLYVQSAEAVRLTLPATQAVSPILANELGPTSMEILDKLRLAQRPLGTGQIVDLVGKARPTVIRNLNRLREAELIRWEGESPQDPRAVWILIQ
ncbi:ATP-dependent DNA helicase RecG [Arcanobacterium pluranimalium]|uniref:ATP-binding protein n=1 Tax=Arcanobacterium pluranimalium TaxID=108028 RepID=UPI00195AF188|nr:ATP-binding protein [Arcanobacterium pluranimalium]MBM7824340.1 ATP-dependent DNA helicase RecG [Arcanobacterium pluranimalium]